MAADSQSQGVTSQVLGRAAWAARRAAIRLFLTICSHFSGFALVGAAATGLRFPGAAWLGEAWLVQPQGHGPGEHSLQFRVFMAHVFGGICGLCSTWRVLAVHGLGRMCPVCAGCMISCKQCHVPRTGPEKLLGFNSV